MSGRAYGYRGGRQDRNPRTAPRWAGNDVRNVASREYRGSSGSWQTQQRQQTMYGTSSGANYGRREPAPYKSPPRDVRPSRPAFQRAQPLPHRARSGSGFGTGLSGGYRKPGRSITVRRTLKPERSRKRYLKDESYRRESKRPRLSAPRNWPKKSSGAPKSSRTRLKPSTLILASGVPGEAEEHEFLDVRFQSHPFIQPFVTVNSKTGMITVEVVAMTRYGSSDARDRCEFSILKHDINSIIAFEGDKIPDGITKRKIDPEKDQEKGGAVVKGEEIDESDNMDNENEDINPDSMPSEELRRELKKRGLESRGLKGELITRLKGAMTNDGALMPQSVDPNALFIHVNSEEEGYSAEDYGDESERERANKMPDKEADERHLTEEEEEEKVADEAVEPEHENPIIEPKKKQVSESEYTIEECYAYVSGIQGKVRKKDLLTIFKEFGKIVGIKQVARKCRIQFDAPEAVDKLINRTIPLLFNGHALIITRDPAVKVNSRSKKNDSVVAETEPMDADEHHDRDSEVEQYSDEEVETGRGVTKKDTEAMDTDEVAFDEDESIDSNEVKTTSKRRKAIPKKRRASPRKRTTRKGKSKRESTAKGKAKRKGRSTKKSSGKKKKPQPKPKHHSDSEDQVEQESKAEIDNDADIQSTGAADAAKEQRKQVVEPTATEGEFDFSNEAEADSTENTTKEPVDKGSDHDQAEDDSRKEVEEPEDEANEDSVPRDSNIKKDSAAEQQTSPMEEDQRATRDEEPNEEEALEFEEEVPEDDNPRMEDLPEKQEMSGEEENLYKDTVGLKNGMSMLEHLKKQANASKGKPIIEEKLAKSSNEEKAPEKAIVAKTGEEDKREDTQEPENFTARSYRVVIAMKRGAKILRRSDTLLHREVVGKTRIVVLEFAITPKNMEPKEVFSTVIDGPLKDYAHGDVWPESGALSFKRTLTKVLTQMQKSRAIEKRASTVDALFEENNQLKMKNEELDLKIKETKDEIDNLKKTIKVARGFLL